MNVSDHTTKVFDADLTMLTQMIGKMGGLAQQQILDSIDALANGDVKLAHHVIAMDVAVDELQQKIEEKVVATIALRQPMAIDLRALIAMLRITNDLERIGDLAKNVSKRVIAMTGEGARPALIRSLKRMTTLVVSQLAAVLESFTDRDATKALRVWEGDKDIDDMHDALFRELLTYAMEDAGIISTCVQLLFCAKNIERMGDHATNIAEAVHYMVNGYPFADERPKSTH